MKSFFSSLRVLIAAGSLAGFVGGWALLAHANKPVDAAQLPAPIIAPAPSQSSPSNSTGRRFQLQPLTQQPSFGFSTGPRLRTGGS